MFKFSKSSKVDSLQKKYDRLMKEAYLLTKVNSEESKKKQLEAQEIHKQIITLKVA